MARQILNFGAVPNDRTGDSLRTLFQKADGNFAELYGRLLFGTLAARPAANAVPADTLYIVTDSTPPNRVFRSDGLAWTVLDAVPDISAHVTHSVAQSIATGTTTALAFDTERYDTDAIHDTATNNSRLTCTAAGKYKVWGGVGFQSNNTGYRQVWARINGVVSGELAPLRTQAVQGADHYIAYSQVADLIAGDYVELMVHQTSGGALNVLKSAGSDRSTPAFGMVRIS
jgi:hypothetical protein